MKTNIWKFTTFLFASMTVLIFTLSSFKNRSEIMKPAVGDTEVLTLRSDVRALYDNFAKQYSDEAFNEKSGSISKSSIQALLSKMTNRDDVKVYYYFGRNANNQNVIMFFNDPAFNAVDKTNKYVTIAPFCPPNCNTALNDYVTTDK